MLSKAKGIILNDDHTASGVEFDKIVNPITDKFINDFITPQTINNKKTGKRPSVPKYTESVRIILSYLYYEWSHSIQGYYRCVRYSRSRSGYANRPLSYIQTIKVIEWLTDNNYIEVMRGYHFGEGKRNKMSRMRPLIKLDNIFRNISRPTFKSDHILDRIVIKDNDKTQIDAPKLIDRLESLKLYGSEMSQLDKQRQINKVRMLSGYQVNNKEFVVSPLYRVFNNSTLDDGGRFYGSAEQLLPKKLRPKLHIDHQPTIERDFRNIHIKMLYDLEGVQLTVDSYTIKDYDREMMKVCVMVLLNAKNEVTARSAIHLKLIRSPFKGVYNAQTIINDIKEYHTPIADYFGSGIGLRLQNYDSEIALEVMYYFSVLGIPCLCVHDSFIVAEEHGMALDLIMEDKYKVVMGYINPYEVYNVMVA